jgi:hypothetical protein
LVEFAVPWNATDCAGAPFRDLRNQDLWNETLLVELSRYEGPHFKVTTEDDYRIRRSYRIRNDPELGRPTQQSRVFPPNSSNEKNEQQYRCDSTVKETLSLKWNI